MLGRPQSDVLMEEVDILPLEEYQVVFFNVVVVASLPVEKGGGSPRVVELKSDLPTSIHR